MSNNDSPTQGESIDDPLLQINEQWALLPPDPDTSLSLGSTDTRILTFFMPWIADDNMPAALLAACQHLVSNPPEWAGFQLEFAEKPSPGFVIRITKGWEPANPAQERNLFQKMLWEIQRIERN